MAADSRSLVAWLLGFVTGCAPAGTPDAQTANNAGVVRGSVAYRERLALPPDAIVEVRLYDVSRQDVAAPVIAETTILPEGRQVPLRFELRYDPSRIQPNHPYAVRATIRSGGRMIFTTDAVYQVITRGNPTEMDLWLVRVGGDAQGTTGDGATRAVLPTRQAFRAPVSRSGRLVLAAGKLRFIACGEASEGIPAEDLPKGDGRALVRELGAGENGMAVLVRLDRGRLQEIRYAGPEGSRCDQLPPEGEVEARGNEPFWMIRVEGTRARVHTPEEPDGVAYDDGTFTRADGERWRYEARRTTAIRVEHLTLEVTEERCVDTMSGARYPFHAVLIRDGNRMEGCALEGRRARATMSGR